MSDRFIYLFTFILSCKNTYFRAVSSWKPSTGFNISPQLLKRLISSCIDSWTSSINTPLLGPRWPRFQKTIHLTWREAGAVGTFMVAASRERHASLILMARITYSVTAVLLKELSWRLKQKQENISQVRPGSRLPDCSPGVRAHTQTWHCKASLRARHGTLALPWAAVCTCS